MPHALHAPSQERKLPQHPEPQRRCAAQAAAIPKRVPLQLDVLGCRVQMSSVQSTCSKAQPRAFYHKLLNSTRGPYCITPLIYRGRCLNVSPLIRAREQRLGVQSVEVPKKLAVSPECGSTVRPTEAQGPAVETANPGRTQPLSHQPPKGRS